LDKPACGRQACLPQAGYVIIKDKLSKEGVEDEFKKDMEARG